MKIVYESNTGHTEKYANMLAKKLNLTSIPLKQYKIDSEPIIFLGWLFANNIQGYKKVKDKANIKLNDNTIETSENRMMNAI